MEENGKKIAGVIQIRQANANDLPAIKELWVQMIDFHTVRDSYFQRAKEGHERFGEYVREYIESPEWLILVAVTADRVIGFSMGTIASYPPVYQQTHHGYIADMVVAEEFRDQGIGTRIFENMIPWFRENGVTRIELEVATANEISQSFWNRIGFRDYMHKMVLEL